MSLSEYNSQIDNKSRWRPPPSIMIRPRFGTSVNRLLGDNHGEATRMWSHYARKSLEEQYAGKQTLFPVKMKPFWSDPRNLLWSNILRAMSNMEVNVSDIYVNVAFMSIIGYVSYVTERLPWFLIAETVLSVADFVTCRVWGTDYNVLVGDNLQTKSMTDSSK